MLPYDKFPGAAPKAQRKMNAKSFVTCVIVCALAAGCASTAHLRVTDSAGAPIESAVVFYDARSMYPHLGRRTEVVLSNTNGVAGIKGGPSSLSVGKKGYFPSMVDLSSFPRVVDVKLYATNQVAFCLEQGPLDEIRIYSSPYLVREEQMAAYRQWTEYLEWLRSQPKLLSEEVQVDISGAVERRGKPSSRFR